MRTTLDIDDDLLAAAKELARRQGSTAGEVVSSLLRRALTGHAEPTLVQPEAERPAVAGFRPFPAVPGVVVTDDAVRRLRDAEGV
jgi:hypothetical protein